MKLSIYVASLLTITCNIYCASAELPTPEELHTFAAGPQYGWTDNPGIARTVAYHVGSDDCGIRAHHTKTFHYDKHLNRHDADNFGFAIVDNARKEPTLMYVHKTEFAQLTRIARFFEIDSNNYKRAPILEPIYPQNQVIPDIFLCRYLFLSKDPQQSNTILDLLQKNAQTLCTIIAAASFLRALIPTTTFVLFDAVDYFNTIFAPSNCDAISDNEKHSPVRKRNNSI